MNRILHRDLCPENLLISRTEGILKITRFNHAVMISPPVVANINSIHVSTQSSLWYRAPEILLGCKTYALPVDIWSVGTILAEMVAKKPLFPGDETEIDQLFKIFR